MLTLCLLFYKLKILRWIFWSWKHTNKLEFIQNSLGKMKIRKLPISSAFLGCIHGLWMNVNTFKLFSGIGIQKPPRSSGRLPKFAFFSGKLWNHFWEKFPHLSDRRALQSSFCLIFFHLQLKEAPFWNLLFPDGHGPKGRGCKGLPWFGALFFLYLPVWERGGSKVFGQCLYIEPTHLEKGASLIQDYVLRARMPTVTMNAVK